MEWLAWLGVVALVVVGLVGMVLPLLPGSPLVLAGLWLGAAIDGFTLVSGWTMGLITVLAVLAWGVDYVAALIAVRQAGASRQAMAAAGAGTVAGLFTGWWGLLLGPALAASAGEWHARRDAAQALRVGTAAGLSVVLGLVVKLSLGVLMVLCFALAYWL
ncbi:DUF456 domain-containing protein [Roseateles sp. BYS180W]|uniref:DUF456 domain-containing protein n=1 Tax=Roseateles rivi TaxID=3299028 RepID=A0ABW7FRY5_9BURK